MISETITFNFDDEQQQKRFHARSAGETKLVIDIAREALSRTSLTSQGD